jgi:hypothetical protein
MAKAFRLIFVMSHSISYLLLIKDLMLFNVFMANVFLLIFVLQHIISNLRLISALLLLQITIAMIWRMATMYLNVGTDQQNVQRQWGYGECLQRCGRGSDVWVLAEAGQMCFHYFKNVANQRSVAVNSGLYSDGRYSRICCHDCLMMGKQFQLTRVVPIPI